MDQIDEAIRLLAQGFASLKGIGATEAASDEILFDEWDWEVGVGLYGAFREAQARGDAAGLARLGRWYDRQIARGLPARQVNSTAPMLALACLTEVAPRDDLRALCLDWAEWLMTDLPKTEEGGFEHVVKEGRRPGQLWDDTLVMAVLSLAQTGRMCDRPDMVSEAHYQFLTHLRFLADPETGLFFHGWTFEGRHNYARARWARGNAWVSIAIPELFRIAPPTDPAVRRYLTEVLRTQLTAVARLQRPDGMVHTLLDDPTGPVEASATAGFGYAVLAGLREGLLPEAMRAVADKAQGAILSRVGDDGILADVSDGTPMGDTWAFYNELPNVAAPYGQALALLFLTEVQR
ncbi:glycoside hydrolase family 88/105 protein [Tropicibacter alexandrii]|uniref:beta-galactosidase BglB n=1 Tax=Tropicibacter alexandrii TaxID=2267683 RepID=UPI001F0BC610|nr:glycoside hydrolase family 88 protein [Tropicibacter alexandrii]